MRSQISYPIIVKEQFRGVLCIHQSDRIRRWTELNSRSSRRLPNDSRSRLRKRVIRDGRARQDRMGNDV